MYCDAVTSTVYGYVVPVPLTNGGCTTMLSLINAIEELDKTCNRVFENIEFAVQKSRETLEGIQGRIEVCAARVEQLQGRREAMVVKSRVRFPKRCHRALQLVQAPRGDRGTLLRRRQRPVPALSSIHDSDDDDLQENVYDANFDNNISGNEQLRRDELKQSNFYQLPVRRLEGTVEEQRPAKPQCPMQNIELGDTMPLAATWRYHSVLERGLGRLPPHMRSVSSLLLFNTRENLYKEYHELDVLKQQREERTVGIKRRLGGTADVHRDYMTRYSSDEYAFVPLMEEVANLMEDLPEDLPLEGIAEVAWNAYTLEAADNIAPSWQRRLGEGSEVATEIGGFPTGGKSQREQTLAITPGPASTVTPPVLLSPSSLPPLPPPPPPGFSSLKAPPPPPPPPAKKIMMAPPPPPSAPPPPPPLPISALPRTPSEMPVTRSFPVLGNPPPAPPPPPPPTLQKSNTAKTLSKLEPRPTSKTASKSNLDTLSSLLANRRKGILGMHSDEDDEDEPQPATTKGARTFKGEGAAPPLASKAVPPPPPPPPPVPGKLPPRRVDDDDDDW